MKLHRKHLVTGGIALTLAIGGGAYGLHNSVYAAGTGGSATVEPSQGSQTDKAQKPVFFKGVHEKGYVKDAADILGVKPEDLTAALKGGKSLADVASEKNMAADTLIAKLTEKQSQKIDQAVKNGKLTQENADAAKKKLADFTKRAVEQKGLPREGRHPGGEKGKGYYGLKPDQLAGILGITQEELQKELAAGKSLAEVAQAHNMSKDQLVAKLKEAMTPSLEKYVDRKGTDRQGHFYQKGQFQQKDAKGQKPTVSPSPSPAAQG